MKDVFWWTECQTNLRPNSLISMRAYSLRMTKRASVPRQVAPPPKLWPDIHHGLGNRNWPSQFSPLDQHSIQPKAAWHLRECQLHSQRCSSTTLWDLVSHSDCRCSSSKNGCCQTRKAMCKFTWAKSILKDYQYYSTPKLNSNLINKLVSNYLLWGQLNS